MAKIQPIPSDRRFIDLTGKRFGHLFVVGYAGISASGRSVWHCICGCTRSHKATYQSLKSGTSTCGCVHGCTLTEYLLRNRSIDVYTGCWNFADHRNSYARFRFGGHRLIAHRVSYEHFVGSIPEGYMVCHKCDNRSCFRPDHLFIGTHQDNMDDMRTKGRSLRGDRHNLARLTEDDVKTLRHLYSCGMKQVDIAKKFGIKQVTVSAIVTRRLWRHVT